MRTSRMAHIEAGWPEGTEAGPEPPAEQQATGAMRSWLVRGTRKFTVDRRRRFGRHAQSRRLLAAGGAVDLGTRGSWQDVVAALQRQAVQSALAQLRRADRQILTLAYLQGRTNREIAAMLGVSVSTVRRRISAALGHLDEYVKQARIWVMSMAVLGAVHLRSTRWPGALTTGTAATAAVVALGVIAVGPDSSLEPRQPTRPPAITTIGDAPAPPAIVLRGTNAQPDAPAVIQLHSVAEPAVQAEQTGQNSFVNAGEHERHKRQAPQTDKKLVTSARGSEAENQSESQEQGPD